MSTTLFIRILYYNWVSQKSDAQKDGNYYNYALLFINSTFSLVQTAIREEGITLSAVVTYN